MKTKMMKTNVKAQGDMQGELLGTPCGLSQYDLGTMYACMSIVILENQLPGCTQGL